MLPRDSSVALKRRQDYRPPPFLVDALDLTLDLEPESTAVTARLAFRRNPYAADRDAPLTLDGEQQEAVEIELDGVPVSGARLRLGPGTLTIADPPLSGTLTVRSRIAPARNVALEGLYVSSGVFCTQCESEGFRRITYFPDRPDILTRYTVTLRADRTAYPVLLSNGNLVAQGALPGGRHFATWHDPFPKPSYLFALVAGDLASLDDSIVTKSGRDVALQIYSTPANIPRCPHAMAALKDGVPLGRGALRPRVRSRAFHDLLRRRFQHGRYGEQGPQHLQQPAWCWPIRPSPPTTTTPRSRRSSAHEYFHNWTGNRVTCRDWFQLSLKEGLTVFRDQEFSSDLGRAPVERIGAVEYLRREQLPEDAGPHGAQRAARRVPRDQQLLHGHRLRKGRRGHPDAAHAARRPSVSGAAWTSTSSATIGRR